MRWNVNTLWYGRMWDHFNGCLRCGNVLSKVWVNMSKAGFSKVVRNWWFGCSKVYKIEQIRCSSQRHLCSPMNTDMLLLGNLHVTCGLYTVSFHMNLADFSKPPTDFSKAIHKLHCSVDWGNVEVTPRVHHRIWVCLSLKMITGKSVIKSTLQFLLEKQSLN